jgi:hypothetical protein
LTPGYRLTDTLIPASTPRPKEDEQATRKDDEQMVKIRILERMRG